MGTGGPLEAEYALRGPIDAGTWTLVGDGIIIVPTDVRFELLWRDGDGDHPIATFEHHFEPGDPEFDAVAYEASMAADAVPASEGDLLILRYQAIDPTQAVEYIPNGDGETHNGRLPYIDLPR